MRLLIVEDDASIARFLCDALTEEGYACDHAVSATEAAALIALFEYQLILLDVMLPEGHQAGFEWAETLRRQNIDTPILYLTARGQVTDRVRGLDAGGDDYLIKPFAYQELMARVRALLRRLHGNTQNIIPLPLGWELNLSKHCIRHPEYTAELTRKEFHILALFALNPERMFSRADIIERLWSGSEGIESKVIDVYVSTLRRKIHENIIETVRGVGYRLGHME